MRTVTLTGASGYIGLRMIPRLIERGFNVRCVVRDPEYLLSRPFSKNIEIVKADFTSTENLDKVFENAEAAYYLIHSMNDSERFENIEKICAENFSVYAKKHGIKKIIYLGGLSLNKKDISRHIESRILVGNTLRTYNKNVTEFRAGIIIGSGSVSFEMIRYTAQRLPFLPYIKQLDSLCEPIAIRDVLSYLIEAIDNSDSDSKIIEIAGPDILKYIDMLKIYLKIRGIKKPILRCPINNPHFCARIISSLSPIPYNISEALFESLKNQTIKTSDLAEKIFPEIKPIDYETQVKYALRRIVGNDIESIWTTSYIPHYIKKNKTLSESQGVIMISYSVKISSTPEKIFSVIKSIGGKNGYFYLNFLWKLRALLDKFLGGVGMRNGRRNLNDVHPGETIDFWRVENIKENSLFLLRSEMRMHGRGWLKFEITDDNKLLLTAYFEPEGLLGYLYWYALVPVHKILFKGMLKRINRLAV
ncbi:MAG: SDR family oxidoreductase [Elusimicrobiales bacterium]|nr:SDR family oxidoreductase [Elusimicrobiales bacterium]